MEDEKMINEQNASKNAIYVVLLLVLILFVSGIGGFIYLNQDNDSESTVENSEAAPEDSDAVDGNESELSQNGESEMVDTGTSSEDEVVSEQPGSYLAYNSARLADAKDGKVVIFFAAYWCPTCKILEKNLNANLDKIPSNVTILRQEYEEDPSLERKYGVTYQHTLVQVDQNGDELKQWSGSYTLEELLSQIE